VKTIYLPSGQRLTSSVIAIVHKLLPVHTKTLCRSQLADVKWTLLLAWRRQHTTYNRPVATLAGNWNQIYVYGGRAPTTYSTTARRRRRKWRQLKRAASTQRRVGADFLSPDLQTVWNRRITGAAWRGNVLDKIRWVRIWNRI